MLFCCMLLIYSYQHNSISSRWRLLPRTCFGRCVPSAGFRFNYSVMYLVGIFHANWVYPPVCYTLYVLYTMLYMIFGWCFICLLISLTVLPIDKKQPIIMYNIVYIVLNTPVDPFSLRGKFSLRTWQNNCNENLQTAHICRNMSPYASISTCWKFCCVDSNIIYIIYTMYNVFLSVKQALSLRTKSY
jgi:hypothetical protein